MNNILVYLAIKYNGDFDKIYNAIMQKEEVDYNEVEKVINDLKYKYITVISKDYPEKLKYLNRPPFVLFYEGDISLLNKKIVGIIGSRNATSYGKKMCEKIVSEIVQSDVVIVSGLARGIDAKSFEVAFENNGKVIGVLGNGLEHYYPLQNKELQNRVKNEGLLISEYPPSLEPEKGNFPKRNRIIAALSDGIIVIEAKKRSGTMITVNEALCIGKDIMCVPDRANENSGCNKLIKNGAYLIESGIEALEIINIK